MKNRKHKRTFFSFFYDNRFFMFISSLVLNVALIGLIVWLSRYAKIKSDVFAQIIGGIVILGLVLNTLFLLAYGKNVRIFRKIFYFVTTLLIVVSVAGAVYIVRAEISLNQLTNLNGGEKVHYSVVGFTESDTLETMGQGTVGFIPQGDIFDQDFKAFVKKSSNGTDYRSFSDYHELLQASLDGEIEFALVPASYLRLQDGFADEDVKPFDHAHVVLQYETEIEGDFDTVDVLKEPFTILLLGNNENLSDSIILATVNPSTLRVTMTSIARDSYVPIACYQNNSYDKLNHSRAKGRQCLVDTVEDFLDVNVDFYFETDFFALQKIIDALGGLEIESPVTFAGSFPIEGTYNEYEGVTVPEGKSLLNGKQAVTFARERQNMPGDDFGRQMNQQYVIREIASKLIRERNPQKLVSVLEGASKNFEMNISVDDLTTLLGYAIKQTEISQLEPMDTFRVVTSQITGDTPTINTMSVVVPYEEDVIRAQQVIDYNLKKKHDLYGVTSMTFTIYKPYDLTSRDYTEEIQSNHTNQGNSSTTGAEPDASWSLAQIKNWGASNGYEVRVLTIEGSGKGRVTHVAEKDVETKTIVVTFDKTPY